MNANKLPLSILVGLAVLSMGAAIYLCTRFHLGLWLAGQVVLSVAILQCFFLLQKFGHGSELKSEGLNLFGGHVTSFFCLVPFNQWRFLNSENIQNAPRAIPIQKRFPPPLNVLAYSVKNYWNIKKLFGLFPEKRIRVKFIMSMLVMNCFFLLVMPNVPGFWKKFGIGYFIFLVLVERWLLKKQAKAA